MGLTYSSSTLRNLKDMFNVKKDTENDLVIALAGNPNTGKSTVFNALTGLHQHTGNWPGKTVTNTQGKYYFKDNNYIIVDLPGTYSLLASSIEEIIARDFICFANPNVTVVVLDATCLERNLNLLLQITEITPNVIGCLNLMDEAKKKHLTINIDKLQEKLRIPIIPTTARSNVGLDTLKQSIHEVAMGNLKLNPRKIMYSPEITSMIKFISCKLNNILGEKNINYEWLALRLLDGDNSILKSINKYLNIKLF